MLKVLSVILFISLSVFGETDLQALEIQAINGDAQAQCDLGRCHETGDGVETNFTLAFELYSQSAAQHNADGQYRLGNCYRQGHGVEIDMHKAAEWFALAVEQNHAGAQNNLGVRYKEGKGVPKNYAEAARLYRLAADQGDKHAQCNLAICYRQGQGVKKDLAEAVKWYRLSAEQNHPNGQHGLGCRYLSGEGVEKDPQVAVEWIRKAAKQNYGPAVVSMVYRYEKGEGVEQDLDEATRWYEKALELGYNRNLKKQEELKDYAAIFAEMDQKFHSDSTATGDQYAEWMKAAIEAKDKLNLENEIDPWLEELAAVFSNDWKILRAVAIGYTEAANLGGYDYIFEVNGTTYGGNEDERNRWMALRLMEKAYPLAVSEPANEKEMATLTRDYLITLVEQRADEPKLLKIKTTDYNVEDVSKYDFGSDLSDEIVFFKRPTSLSTAKNDGELALALLGRHDLTIEEITLPKEIQIPLATAGYVELVNERPHFMNEAIWEVLHNLADDEYAVWDKLKPRAEKLPAGHAYIPQLIALADRQPEIIGTLLGTLFQGRCQLDRAATYFEMADNTNTVRSIRANQGTFATCPPQPAGGEAKLEYRFRNGEEVAVELYRINAGTNLFERLEAGTVMQPEFNLLKGVPNWVGNTGDFEKPGALEKIETRTIALQPLSDHRDSSHEIDFQSLEAGAYLVRARMKDGNTAETILNIRDTMLYTASMPSEVRTNAHTLFILCDAHTGKPRPNETIQIVELFGGTRGNENRGTVDTPYRVKQGFSGVTDTNGCYVLEERLLSRPEVELYLLANLDGFPLVMKSSRWDRDHVFPFKGGVQEPFIATDRPIYRPGDEGNLMIWQAAETNAFKLRIREDRSKFDLPIAGETTLLPNFFGAMKATFEVPEEARLGEYEIQLEADEEYGFDFGTLRVEKYRAPEFEVAIKQLADSRIEISAAYAYGAPVAGGRVTGHIGFDEFPPSPWYPSAPFDGLWYQGYWWNGNQFDTEEMSDRRYYYRSILHESIDLTLDADGKAVVDMNDLDGGEKALAATGRFEVGANVTDAANKTYDANEHFRNNAKEANLCCWTDKTFFEQGEDIVVHTAAEKEGELTLRYERIEGTNTTVMSEPKNLEPGLYQVLARDAAGAESQPFQFFVLGNADNGLTESDPIRLVVEKGVYDAADTATILVQVDQPGRHVYFFDRLTGRNAYPIPQTFVMNGTSKRISLPINGDAGEWQCAAMTIVDGQLHAKAGKIRATEDSKKAGRIEITTDQKKYEPGATAKVKLHVVNTSGEGEKCAIAITVYNKTLDALAQHSTLRDIYQSLFSTWLDGAYHLLRFKDGWPRKVSPEAPNWVMDRLDNNGSASFGARSAGTDDLFGDAAGGSDSLDDVFASLGSMDSFGSAQGMAKPMMAYSISAMEQGGVGGTPVYIRENLADHAYWNAFVETDDNGEATIEFEVPDSLTEWKIAAWAMHTNFAASGEASFKCAKDLVVQLNTPRYMIEGDLLEISAAVRNHTTNTLTVMTRCSISILGSVVKALEPATEKMLYWKHKARKPGTKTIKVTANATGVADGIAKPIPVLTRHMLKRGGDSGILTPENPEARLDINIPEDIEPSSLKLELNTTPNMLETVAAALPFLAEYPHGCTEQTLNRFLPSIVVLQTMEKLGLQLEDLGAAMPPDRQAVYDRDEVLKRAQTGINILDDAQIWNGSWSWNLEGDRGNSDPLVTAWVARGLRMAAEHEELSFESNNLSRSVDEMVEHLAALSNPPWRRRGSATLTQTDVLTAVVLQELGPENYLTRESDKKAARELMPTIGPFLMKHANELSLYGKTLLAYFFELRGETEARDELLAHIEQYLETDANLGTFWLRVESDHWWRWYNDEIEIMAWYLKLLNRVEPDSAKTAGVARWLLINRQYGDHWKSTRDTAICIEALCEFIINHPAAAGDADVAVMLNGGPLEIGLKPGVNTLELKANNATVFHDTTWSYQTLEDPIAPERCDLVGVSRSYYRFNADDSRELIGPDEMLTAGETIEVELTFDAPQELEYLLATDRKPAGFECIETQSGYRRGKLSHYQELHNERVAFYINRLPKGESRIRYRLRPEHAGKVSALPATIELMYAPDQAANSKEAKLQIAR